MRCFSQGLIDPIRPIKSFPASQVVDAFRYMQKGQHIGKIVVTMPGEGHASSASNLEIVRRAKSAHFRPDASYLLVGGLGGLGRAVSTWMVENGARSLVYLSRSGGESLQDKAFVRELSAQGCTAQVFKGDAACQQDVEKAIRDADRPIAGVLLMSMVLQVRASDPSASWQS